MLSPGRLEDLCINLLTKALNLDILWKGKNERVFRAFEPGAVEWRDPEQFLHSPVADRMLEFLSRRGTLADEILSTFTQEHVCLRNVTISHCQWITERGLQVLRHHKLVFLDLTIPHSVNIRPVLRYIGNKSCESLQHLILRKGRLEQHRSVWPDRPDGPPWRFDVKTLSRFNCLKRVDVRDTDATDTMLTILGKGLLHVENLNLSMNNQITDISPLKNCQKTLKSLSLCGLYDMEAESAMALFMTLTGLTYLDVSLDSLDDSRPYDYEEYDSFSHSCGRKVFTADMLLEMPDILPNLECLDLSGRTVRSEHALSQFLDAHQPLQTLMLWRSAACQFKSLQDNRPQLTVGGDASLEQYAAVLSYLTRIDQHQGICFESSRRQFVMDKLIKHLKENRFPPCDDDHLVQVVLDMLPRRCRLLSRKDKWFLGYYCLKGISFLVEKRIVKHLEPDTKKNLLLLCHRALLQRPEYEVLEPAQRIINALS